MSQESVTSVLLASLRRGADRYAGELRDIEVALAALELRRAYDLMNRLMTRGVWEPDLAAREALEDFWWEHAQ